MDELDLNELKAEYVPEETPSTPDASAPDASTPANAPDAPTPVIPSEAKDPTPQVEAPAVGGAPSDEGAVENGGKPFETEGGKNPAPTLNLRLRNNAPTEGDPSLSLPPSSSASPQMPPPSSEGGKTQRPRNEGGSSEALPPRNDASSAPSERIPLKGKASDAAPVLQEDKEKPAKKRRVPLFWKIYAIAIAVAIMLICGLLGFFRAALKEYEDTRPLNAAREAVSALAAGEDRPEFIPAEASEFDKAASVAAAFAEAGGTADAEITEKVGVSTEEIPVFSVREGGKEICRVRLKEAGKSRFFKTWQIDGVFFTGDNAVDITLTADTRLLLNGVPVGEGYVTSRDEPLRGYEDFPDVTPKCVRYQIEGLYYEPVITLENDYCEPRAELKNGEWTVAYPGSENSRAEAVQLAYSAAQAYVKYASSQGSPLAPLDRWLIPGSTLRARVLSFDRRYFTRHDSAEFKNMTDLDFSVYGADEFSVKLAFDYVMRTGGKEQTDKTVITLYMLRIDGSWKLSDVAVE
ncbi:MAG: hypothetical protein IJU94_07120 [Clostridia bacterium]|nr:hypothetical protein [Clostridia bacterium]